MVKRSIFSKNDSSLFPVEEVFIDLKNYYDRIMQLLIFESIDLQTDIQFKNEINIDKIKQRAQNLDLNLIQEETLNYENNKNSRLWELTSHYPNNFRSFFITQIYGFIELELELICGEKLPKRKSGKQNRKSKIPNIENLENCINYNWSNSDNSLIDEFSFIKNVRLIRNNIVHSAGIFNLEKIEEIEEMWGKDHGLFEFQEFSHDEFQIVFISDNFIYDFLNFGERLFKKIIENKD